MGFFFIFMPFSMAVLLFTLNKLFAFSVFYYFLSAIQSSRTKRRPNRVYISTCPSHLVVISNLHNRRPRSRLFFFVGEKRLRGNKARAY